MYLGRDFAKLVNERFKRLSEKTPNGAYCYISVLVGKLVVNFSVEYEARPPCPQRLLGYFDPSDKGSVDASAPGSSPCCLV